MSLKSGTIIPIKFKVTKKLISIYSQNNSDKLTIDDVKTAIHSNFNGLSLKNCYFFNPKIGFQIPEDLLIRYLEQRHDLTNFVIEISECASSSSKEADDSEDEGKQPRQIAYKRDCSDGSATMTKKSKTMADSIDYHLEEILKASAEGQAICEHHEINNRLSEEHRLKLIQLMITFEFENILNTNVPLTIDSQRLVDLSSAICRRFPCEDPSFYYVAHSKTLKHIAGGKLYEQFHTMKVYFMETESFDRYYDTSQHTIEADFPELDDLQEISGHWWPYFKAWRHTFELRMSYVRNIFNPLPYFKQLISRVQDKSMDLVEYDFDRLHPEKSNKLFDNWDLLSERIFTEALVFCRNDVPLIMDLYGNMPQLSGFMILSYFLANYESDVKPFQKDDPANLVVHIECIDGKPEEFFPVYCRTKKLSTPVVLATGKNADEMHFYVLVGDSLFCMENVLKAVDFCFKCYRVIHLNYSRKQSYGWQVVQNAFYEIYTDEDDNRADKFLKIFKSL